MKYLILLLAPLFLVASQERLTPIEHGSIHNYNKRPIVKMSKKNRMHKLHKVDEHAVATIVKAKTAEEVEDMKLLHSGSLLKYKIKTEHYLLEINALDGTIISKQKRSNI